MAPSNSAALLVRAALPVCLAFGELWLSGCGGLHKNSSARHAPPQTAATAVTNAPVPTKLTATARVSGPAMPVADHTSLATAAAMRRSAKETRVGEVRVIGGGRRFVLIEVSSRGNLPALSPGLELRCRASVGSPMLGGEETAVLRISPERRQSFVVADVVSGDPRVEDPVFYSPGSAAAPIYQPAFLQESAAQPAQLPQQSIGSATPQATLGQSQAASPVPDATPRYRARATVHPVGE